MKKIIKTLPMIFMILFFSSCGKEDNIYIEKSKIALGTYCSIKVYGTEDESILDKCFERIDEIEKEMSLNIELSEIKKINENAGIGYVEVSSDTLYVLEKGKYYSEISNGKFDITIGNLSELWNISGGNTVIPDEDSINKSLNNVDYNNLDIEYEKSQVSLIEAGMELDLGGIAKGYAADQVVKILKDNNVDSAIINLGGNVYILGRKSESTEYRIGIQDPFYKNDDYLGVVQVENKAVITSGIYERYFEKDGIIYHHILDTKTGYPIDNDLLSVTVITSSSIDGDSLSTLLFAYGLEHGLEYANSVADIDAIFVTKDKEIYLTEGIKEDFELSDSDYKIMK
ncbi:MAG: FAD:protein FMN transferase [Clostridiaceae bacterium]